jgi:hypothetical protein
MVGPDGRNIIKWLKINTPIDATITNTARLFLLILFIRKLVILVFFENVIDRPGNALFIILFC